ncbi:MAG: DMT family transporter, partial [Alphaproteobacteria bacterium]|nr:DMT family transporter [Alphaproteobacteria bacterium]
LAFCNTACSFFVIWGYNYISSGLVTSLRFLYPVLVSVAMICFFGEKKSLSTGLSIFLAVLGVSLLSYSSDGVTVNFTGVVIVLISSVWYAIYLVGTNKSKAAKMDTWTFTFYSMFFGAVFCLAYAVSQNNVQHIPLNWNSISHLAGLIIIATLLPNLALVDAIRRIGSTMTAVLGAFEPVTAVIVGVWIFHEPFTQRIAFSIACILTSVLVLIIAKNTKKIKETYPKIVQVFYTIIKKTVSKTIHFFKTLKRLS